MIAAQQLCEKAGLDFQHVFTRQYCLSKAALPRVECWKRPKQLSGWGLIHCPKLECREIKDKAGKLLGWMLGTAVDQNGKIIGNDGLTLPTIVADHNFWEIVEGEIPFLAGRYVAVLITPKGKRIYSDPVMDLPLVFNAKEKLIGSSPLMALTRPVRINHRIHNKLILKQGGNYGMQQTCDPDVLRALSNHYLDLESFTLHRHWPGEEDEFESGIPDLEETAEVMVARLGQITGTLLENFSCLMPITGGNDSRTLAFSARSKIHLASLCFTHRTNWISGIDCYVGQMAADALGQKLHLIDAVSELDLNRFTLKELRRLRWDFHHRTGYLQAPLRANLIASRLIPEADFVLRANILDMAGANQWPPDFKYNLKHAVSKMAIGGRAQEENLMYWGPEFSNWQNSLPSAAKSRTYDFAFLEHLLPNTLGGRLIGYGRAAYINPFNDRLLIKACMQVDPELRKSGELNQALHDACGAPKLPTVRKIRTNAKLKFKAEAFITAQFPDGHH